MQFRPFLFGFRVLVLHLSPRIKTNDLRKTGWALSITIYRVGFTSSHKRASLLSLPLAPLIPTLMLIVLTHLPPNNRKEGTAYSLPPPTPHGLCFIDSSKSTTFKWEHLTFHRIFLCSIFHSIRKEMKVSGGCFCRVAVITGRCACPNIYRYTTKTWQCACGGVKKAKVKWCWSLGSNNQL